MPIPLPINEWTGTIAVITLLGAFVLRKKFWKAITNWGAAPKHDEDQDL